ncbi:uncharacterized protein LOC129884275 [Solanum dulcamara]|uniref:uncharacterized protein LOC129884275 n=1 Tax=Solanum dulcamara TaxID=45834 RepID=UPI002485AE7F|nr:uncharacterized protein LOC129884275 [Solanum dulcamara]
MGRDNSRSIPDNPSSNVDISNSKIHYYLMWLVGAVTTQLNKHKVTPVNTNVKKRKCVKRGSNIGDNDFNHQKISNRETSSRCSRKGDGKENSFLSCGKCGKHNLEECLYDPGSCYSYGKSGHKEKDCPVASRKRRGECLVELDACYRCGKPGNYVRECRSGTRPQGLAQTIGHPDQSATTSDGGRYQERSYAF